MTNNNIPYFSLRLLTVFVYFLPFVFYLSTCSNDPNIKDAYNKEDAIQNEKREHQIKLTSLNTFISALDTITTNKNAALDELVWRINNEFYSTDNIDNLKKDSEYIIYFPTDYSLSGVGALILNKTLLGKILIGTSMFISLITLFLWVLIKKFKIAKYLFALNILTITVFIIDCYFSRTYILVGIWVLLFLLFMQMLTELQTKRKANH